DNYGATALFWSIILKQFDIAEYLIEAGADVMIADNENSAPLHVASFVGNVDLVKRLITAGADPNRSTSKGNIPLAIAIQQNHKEVAEYLFPIWLGNHI
ncbi:MAG: ankyrin repeat domain-containing protein, partial [Alistipes sp.]|nr:ankyrin repeat domain-containing protein [Alistipes sp.]